MTSGPPLRVPDALVASYDKYFGDGGRVWIAALPRLAEDCLDRWDLRLDGVALCGAVALVLPVVQADGTTAMLKLQPIDDETSGEPDALRAWDGHGAVRLLRHDPDSGAMLLERLDAGRTLGAFRDDLAALQILCELMSRLNAVPAPPGMRRLADIAAGLLDRVPRALELLSDPAERRLLRSCAGAVTELLPESGDRLLHWDLHFQNVLARLTDSAPEGVVDSWRAIDPKPLAGDLGFELLPALHNRWDDVVATGNVPRAVRMRFDLMTEVTGIDRRRAVGWTLGRVLHGLLWEVEHGDTTLHTGPDRAVADALLNRPG